MHHLPELPAPPDGVFRSAHEKLMRTLEPSRVYGAWIEAPFGAVFLARTEKGVCRIGFRQSEEALLSDLERRSLLPEMAPGKLDRERKELEEYFRGKRREFEMPVDLRWGSDFQRRVLRATRKIPFGGSARYADIARRIEQPHAQRAVGNALGRNPIPIVIPCHRVIASGGRIGGYTGGLDIKRTLMKIEGLEVA